LATGAAGAAAAGASSFLPHAVANMAATTAAPKVYWNFMNRLRSGRMAVGDWPTAQRSEAIHYSLIN
jgi:uncharacterized protein (DUF849 family)